MDKQALIDNMLAFFKERHYFGFDTSEHQDFVVYKADENNPNSTLFTISFWSQPMFGERKLMFATYDLATNRFLSVQGPASLVKFD